MNPWKSEMNQRRNEWMIRWKIVWFNLMNEHWTNDWKNQRTHNWIKTWFNNERMNEWEKEGKKKREGENKRKEEGKNELNEWRKDRNNKWTNEWMSGWVDGLMNGGWKSKRGDWKQMDGMKIMAWMEWLWNDCSGWNGMDGIPLMLFSGKYLLSFDSGILSDVPFWHSILASILTSYLASILTLHLTFHLAFFLIFFLESFLAFSPPGSAHWYVELAVGVRQCPLRSGARRGRGSGGSNSAKI